MKLSRITLLCLAVAFTSLPTLHAAPEIAAKPRPNILFCIADDWGRHAGAYGDPVVKTPTFDRLAREGVLFNHAYVSSPSCTPSRGAILTGQYHWRLEAGANLWCIFPDKFASYPELLAKHGYEVGTHGKAWGPGRTETANRPIAGERYKSFDEFLSQRERATPANKANEENGAGKQPFCFWLGSSDPHRDYVLDSGAKSGMALDKIKLPACFPDNATTRGDVADYFFEVQRFDKLVGEAVAALEKAGELENTIIVVTSDHGMPFPRGKGNLYDTGVRVPLAIRWGQGIPKPGRTVDDFVSLCDLAPTFLELAAVPAPRDMTGRSLAIVLTSGLAGQVDAGRLQVYFGKERHVPCQETPDLGGYPCRGLRTHDYLYIRNFSPERWPNGTPDWRNATIRGIWLGDCDNGPTKTYLVEHRERSDEDRRLYELSFGKRPAEELYDLQRDPEQLVNVAADAGYAEVQKRMAEQLTSELKATGDLRILGRGEEYERNPYLGQGPRHPDAGKDK